MNRSCAGSPTTVVIQKYLYRVQNFTKQIQKFFTYLIIYIFYMRKYILLIGHIGHDIIQNNDESTTKTFCRR